MSFYLIDERNRTYSSMHNWVGPSNIMLDLLKDPALVVAADADVLQDFNDEEIRQSWCTLKSLLAIDFTALPAANIKNKKNPESNRSRSQR
jgi:hypothetical protein